MTPPATPADHAPHVDATPLTAPPRDLIITMLDELHQQLTDALGNLILDHTPTGRAALLTPLQQQITSLRPAIDEVAPTALALLHERPESLAPGGLDHLVTDVEAAKSELFRYLHHLGLDAYRRREPSPATWAGSGAAPWLPQKRDCP